MFQPVSLFIGLRYSRSQNRSGFVSFITFFSIAGILLGVASLITVVSVMNGFEGELKKRILGLVPHVIITENSNSKNISSKNSTNKPIMSDWPEVRKALLKQPHVLQVTPLLEAEALIQSTSTLQGVLLQGIIPEYETNNIVRSNMVGGTLASLSLAPYNLVMGQALARELKVSLGDKVRIVLLNKTVFTPMGRIPVQRTFTVSGLFNVGSQVDAAMVYVHSNSGAKLLRRKGDGINQLRLYLDDAFNANTVVEGLHALNSTNNQANKYQITTWNESQGVLFSAVKMEKNMMWLMLSLIIAVATFNIISALVMVVIDKQGEIGILQTLGLNRLGILKIFITQGMVNGLWGVILGTLLGLLLTFNLNTIIAFVGADFALQTLPVQLEWFNVLVIVLSALAMSFLATLYPAYHASTTLPAEVLRNE